MTKDIRKNALKMLARATELGLTSKTGTPLVVDVMEELLAATEGYRNAHAYRAALASRETPALVQDHPDEANNDYTLVKGKGCWITMESFSIHPYLTSEGVVVDIYPLGACNESITTTAAFTSEAEEGYCADWGIDVDSVAEWVELHYAKNFDTEAPAKRFEWIVRYKESLDTAAALNADKTT